MSAFLSPLKKIREQKVREGAGGRCLFKRGGEEAVMGADACQSTRAEQEKETGRETKKVLPEE